MPPYISGPTTSCSGCQSTRLRLVWERWDVIDHVFVAEVHCDQCGRMFLDSRRSNQPRPTYSKGSPMAKRATTDTTEKATPRPRAGRKNWSAGRRNTLPSNGDAAESREVLPEKVSVGEAMRRAVEALGDVTVNDDLAGQQMRQLAELYENVAKEQAAYDKRAEAAKVAKKALESAQNLLMEQVRAFTHANPLPLFDRQQAEEDRQRMEAGDVMAGDEIRTGVHAEH